jgi:hypothetical protein
LERLAKVLNAMTALLGVLAASGLLLWLTGLPEEHFNSESEWRCHQGWERDWRGVNFDDRAWGHAISPAPHRTDDVAVGEGKFPTMWIVPDSTEATFRLTFNVSNLTFMREATLLSISDDDHEVYLNGLAIVFDGNRKAGPLITTDLRRLLRQGKNVLAVHAEDRREPKRSRWMAIDLRIRHGLPGSL